MKHLPQFDENNFKKSSLCHHIIHCVKVAHKDGTIAIKDSKNPQQGALYFNKGEWEAFVSGVKNGEFDF